MTRDYYESCSDNHEPIDYYEGDRCPLCEALRRIEDLEAEAADDETDAWDRRG